MVKATNYVLWGSAGHAKVLASLITLRGGRVVALFDNNPQATSALAGVPLHVGKEGFLHWLKDQSDPTNFSGLVAIGGSRGLDRIDINDYFRAHDIRVHPVIHPHASVCQTAFIGAGTQVLAHAVIAADAHLGEACIVNHRAAADHECVLGDGVHLAPGATLCGCVKVGNNVLIGAGAVILPRITIGANTIVGAGAVVTKDLPAGVVAIGNPARIIRHVLS